MEEHLQPKSGKDLLNKLASPFEALLREQKHVPWRERLAQMVPHEQALCYLSPNTPDEEAMQLLDGFAVNGKQRELLAQLRGWCQVYFSLTEDERVVHGDVVSCFMALGIADDVLGPAEYEERSGRPLILIYGPIVRPGLELHSFTGPDQQWRRNWTLRRRGVVLPMDIEE